MHVPLDALLGKACALSLKCPAWLVALCTSEYSRHINNPERCMCHGRSVAMWAARSCQVSCIDHVCLCHMQAKTLPCTRQTQGFGIGVRDNFP